MSPAPAQSGASRARPMPWGIGWCLGPQGPVGYPASHEEIDAATDVAAQRLRSLGVAPGSIVLIVGRSSEAVQLAPYERATNQLGSTFTCVDGLRSDAHRLVALTRLFRPVAVLGLGQELLTGLEEDLGEDPVDLFSSTRVIAARPSAQRALSQLGVDALLWLHAGPAVALGCRAGAGAHLDSAWDPIMTDGGLRVTLPPSHQPPGYVTTKIMGWVDNSPCPCGTDSPRVIPTAVPPVLG